MAERPREYPRQEAASASFADTARAGTEAVLQRLDTSPSDEGRAIALRQAGEIRACMDARCEAVGRRDPALASVSARLDEAIAEDRRAAIEAIRADASKFDSLPLDLRRDPDFRREAMRANMLVVRRWSYYEGATENEVRFVFAQTLRSPSLLAGMPPEIIERFFYTCRDQVTMQHFLVLDEWRASIVVGRLVAHGIYSFGSESAPVALADAIVLLRPKKLFSEPAAAAKLLNDTKLFHRAEGESMASFAERLRDAVPPAKWADVGYVLALLPLLDIPAKSFPFGVLATEVRDDPEARIWGDSAAMALIDMKMDGTGAEMEGRGKLLAALSGIKSLEQLRADPATVAAIAREPSLVRAMPLSSQTDVGVMAYLASRVPELASRRLMAPEILSDPRIVAACHEGARLDPAHDVGQLGYEQCSLRDMRELARVHGASVTSDLRFLERIESAMSQGTWDEFSQGKKDAKIVQPGEREAWREFYETTYSRERGFADAIRDIGWKWRSATTAFDRMMIDDPAAFDTFASEHFKQVLPGLDANSIAVLYAYGPKIRDMLFQTAGREGSPQETYRFLSVFREDIRRDPTLATKLSAALVSLSRAYAKLRQERLAASGAESLASDEVSTRFRQYAETANIRLPADTKSPQEANAALWRAVAGHAESVMRRRLLAMLEADKSSGKPETSRGALLARAIGDTLAQELPDLDPRTREILMQTLRASYWDREQTSVLASAAGLAAMRGTVTQEEFARQAAVVADTAFAHYAAGLSAEESFAALASPEYLSAARALAPQASATSATGTSPLGYPAAADGSLVVASADRGVVYSLDPTTGRISSPDGLSLSVRPDADRESVERAVSSLDFLRDSGMSFLGGDVERVFVLAHRLDPASSLTPQDGLDESERRLLLSALLPFFGIDLPAGAIYTDMTAALDRLNRGTTDRESGLLTGLARRGVPYIDAETLAFDFRAFETAFGAWSKERFDSPAVSI